MTKLSVNVNKIALLRNARALDMPDVGRLAGLALQSGASGITVHPRPDERHIRKSDVLPLSEVIKQFPNAEFNIEGNPFHQLMDIIREIKPHQVTLVPDDIAASTSDHGWDLATDGARLEPIIQELKSLEIRVSLFMDPLADQMIVAKELGADRIELYTEAYANAYKTNDQDHVTGKYHDTAVSAAKVGLGINAGHDLNLDNLSYFLSQVPQVEEVSIGHALTADALEYGIENTVQRYLAQIQSSYT
ncbi:MAG: pyridoxine 5'-phosphate synthase [Betaproteobacteria bacterium]|jgi:pyridoxine 5-phosphate synthase|nr:pyridoxine 5'-phosphate synthase [Betaproteobacteria bacterium]MBT6411658.1 pyridoxine 5'-phosphate synthase [Betaproteobacteria bacterium]MCH1424252.1 pyridoxine 5'-phosphate synthase [Burkholderiales bacterium]